MKYKQLWQSDVYDNTQSTLDINEKYIRYTTEFLYEYGRKEVKLYDVKYFLGDVKKFLNDMCNCEPTKTYNK